MAKVGTTKTGSRALHRQLASPAGLVDPELSGHETVRPTPDILDALERDYPLEASVADLVDNSIDAKARHVVIRFIRSRGRLVSLCVADNGTGMTGAQIRRAMQFAARRKYRPRDLGMFGVGLKTASLSQADKLIVVSRAKGGNSVGRQWTKSGIKKRDWSLDILTPRSSAEILDRDWGVLGPIRRGTVVRWDRVYDFERLQSGIDEYLEQEKQRLRNHLGLKLHRFLARNAFQIVIEVEDADTGEVGPPSRVLPMNPFPPDNARGAKGYPRVFVAHFPSAGRVKMRAHIWRKKSRDEGYKLGGGRVAEHQGFYFFRHDRLIQDGGWNGLIGTNEPHMSLARVEVDIPDQLRKYLKVRSNKAGVDVPATFGPSVREARSKNGTTFDDFLQKAQEVYRHRTKPAAKPMLLPGSGIPADVKKALQRNSIQFTRGQTCTVVWRGFRGRGLIRVDQANSQIILNKAYRNMLLRGAHAGTTDLPLLRTLLYFVFEPMLAGERIGPVEGLRLKSIQAAMDAALKLEKKWADR